MKALPCLMFEEEYFSNKAATREDGDAGTKEEAGVDINLGGKDTINLLENFSA